jgi:methylmalonyl-CoA mutase C-terminal domain/subunit
MSNKVIRVLIAKVGLDGHDRGAKVVARYLRDAGMEVIYTGTRQTVDEVVNVAEQEDVDVVGLSFLAGDHMVLLPRIMAKFAERGLEDVLVIVGGIILRHQESSLKELGVSRVFYPGADPDEIVRYVRENVVRNA